MVVCRSRHLCRGARSSLSVSCPISGVAVPSLCSFLLVVSGLIGTYNQFFIPRNQVSHIRISSASPLPCAIAHFSSLPSIPASGTKPNPQDEHFPLFFATSCTSPLPSFSSAPLVDHAVLGIHHSHTCHALYTPTFLFERITCFSPSHIRKYCIASVPVCYVTFSLPRPTV
ncbi:hypothetical protein BJV78DRAFT_464433 [Lactifluus subvellereus]|nr:hypothetical protein BJV78DRAFT_464433 [Lactifluus subvellereus]